MKCPKCNFVFKDPDKVKGGKTSKRKLSTEESKRMIAIREQKKKEGK